MAVSRLSQQSLQNAFPKGNTVWDGTTATSAFDSLGAVVVPSAGQASITFSSIPQTYTHLQIRCLWETNIADNLGLTLNGSTAPVRIHSLYGAGTSAVALSDTANYLSIQVGTSTTTFYAGIIDLLDYTNTNKNKTVRMFGGVDFNGSGVVFLSSGLYDTTSAVSSLTLQTLSSRTFPQYSSFALYGIK
jgi:hypothetical protein